MYRMALAGLLLGSIGCTRHQCIITCADNVEYVAYVCSYEDSLAEQTVAEAAESECVNRGGVQSIACDDEGLDCNTREAAHLVPVPDANFQPKVAAK